MTISTWIFAALALGGFLLGVWACVVNRNFGSPDEPPGPWITTGPYRFMRHPIYMGNVACISGLAGLGGGWWSAAAVGMLTQLLMADWIHREEHHTAYIRRRAEAKERRNHVDAA